MKKVLLMGLWSMVTILLTSCEGGTTFTKTITNNSSETLTIEVFSNVFSASQSFTIAPNEAKEIYWDDQMGRFTDETYTCTIEFDSVHVSISNSKTLQKDLLNNDNWTNEHRRGHRNSYERCSLEITDDDLD